MDKRELSLTSLNRHNISKDQGMFQNAHKLLNYINSNSYNMYKNT